MADMDEYRDIFLSESAEYLQAIVDGLLRLEEEPNDLEPVETVFRGAHSLKGMSATMGYERTADLTHKMEGLMETVRKRQQPPDHGLIDLMLESVDAVRGLIRAESDGKQAPSTGDLAARIVERTESATADEAGRETPDRKPAPGRGRKSAGAVGRPSADEATQAAAEPAEEESGEQVLDVRVTLESECVLKSVRAYMVIKRLSQMGAVLETRPSAREIEDEQFDLSFEVVLRTAASRDAVVAAASSVSEVASAEVTRAVAASTQKAANEPAAVSAKGRESHHTETQTVRVTISHLDNMVNLVGELVILRSRLERMGRELDDREMLDALEELRQVSSELQHEVMQTRMVPVSNIFNRFPRMVRDLSRDLGKEVGFEMDGLEIELDRTVLDEIGDPIVHLLRNAIDHGLESPEERIAAGKSPKGHVHLSAARERDSVEIVVADDGRGMDVERIWKVACERGMADAGQREQYTHEQILQFTCTPGFSTAEQATKVSGRGVGMDVVRGKIELLGGALYIRSTPGEGSAFVLTLPLTLAIIQALLVGHEGQVYAMPLGSVTEVLSPEDAPVETVDGKPVVVLRDGSVAPVYRLAVVLGEPGAEALMPTGGEHVVLVEMGGKTRALAAQRLIGRQEIVVKPLGRMFGQIRGLGGATVLGDGRVALILDPRSLFTLGEQAN
jgi:two-component system chemotaxis sensor kinase CheA